MERGSEERNRKERRKKEEKEAGILKTLLYKDVYSAYPHDMCLFNLNYLTLCSLTTLFDYGYKKLWKIL